MVFLSCVSTHSVVPIRFCIRTFSIRIPMLHLSHLQWQLVFELIFDFQQQTNRWRFFYRSLFIACGTYIFEQWFPFQTSQKQASAPVAAGRKHPLKGAGHPPTLSSGDVWRHPPRALPSQNALHACAWQPTQYDRGQATRLSTRYNLKAGLRDVWWAEILWHSSRGWNANIPSAIYIRYHEKRTGLGCAAALHHNSEVSEHLSVCSRTRWFDWGSGRGNGFSGGRQYEPQSSWKMICGRPYTVVNQIKDYHTSRIALKWRGRHDVNSMLRCSNGISKKPYTSWICTYILVVQATLPVY